MTKPYFNPYAHPDLGKHWAISDAGRKVSVRGRTVRSGQKQESNDCTVRALAIALGMPYDEAHGFCEKLGRVRHKGWEFTDLLRKAEKAKTLVLGHSVQWVSLPAAAGQKRTDAYKLLSSGALDGKRAIAREAHHVWGVRDGIGHDTHMPYAGRCVYGYWLFTPVA